ncbi:MAG: hypothetical protein MN733_07255, partial [Nitrososphaera sp.]|nr:hypothetical protein [Nitrososphaera sp.]
CSICLHAFVLLPGDERNGQAMRKRCSICLHAFVLLRPLAERPRPSSRQVAVYACTLLCCYPAIVT